MRRRHLTLGLFLTALVLLAGCSSEATSTPTTTTDPETAYINELKKISAEQRQARQRFEDLVGPIFPRFAPDDMQARVLFHALGEARISETAAESLRMLEALAPPRRFANDHAAYLESLRKQSTLASDVDEAVQRKDLPHVHLAMAALQAASGVILLSVSSEYCGHISREVGPLSPGVSWRLCRGEQTPGGEYGAMIDGLAKTFVAEFNPRVSFPPGMTPEQLREGLAYVQPAIVKLFEQTLAELDAITPPLEYEVGHQVLQDYFTELLSTARAIDRAVAQKDDDRVAREFERSGEIGRTFNGRLPGNYRPLVEVLFSPDERPR